MWQFLYISFYLPKVLHETPGVSGPHHFPSDWPLGNREGLQPSLCLRGPHSGGGSSLFFFRRSCMFFGFTVTQWGIPGGKLSAFHLWKYVLNRSCCGLNSFYPSPGSDYQNHRFFFFLIHFLKGLSSFYIVIYSFLFHLFMLPYL